MRAGSWRLIARFFTAPGFASELMHLYLATDLRPADGERLAPDEDEHLLVERMPWRDAVAAAERGEIARRQVAGRPALAGPAARRPARVAGIGERSLKVRDPRSAAANAGIGRPRGALPETVEGVAVERRPRAERDRESQVRPGLAAAAEPLQALAEREVPVVRRRIDLEQRLEGGPRALRLARVEVRAAERLEDRALARLEAVGPLEDDRRLRVMAPIEQSVTALEQVVGGLALVRVVRCLVGSSRTPWTDGGTDARRGATSPGRWVSLPLAIRRRSTGSRRGDSVRPGMRPRLAIGCPSISLMSPVKSIGVGAADVRADGVRIDRRPGLLEVADAVRREAARHGDLDVPEARPGRAAPGPRGRGRPSPGRARTACRAGCRTAGRRGRGRRAAPPRPRP